MIKRWHHQPQKMSRTLDHHDRKLNGKLDGKLSEELRHEEMKRDGESESEDGGITEPRQRKEKQ